MSSSYNKLRQRATLQLGDEVVVAEAGASLDTGKSEFENGVIVLTTQRLLFAGETLDSVVEVGLGEVEHVLKEKRLTFPYLVLVTKEGSFSFLFAKTDFGHFHKKAVNAVNFFNPEESTMEADSDQGRDVVGLSSAVEELNDPAHAQKVSRKSLESMFVSLESQPAPVFYSFVVDSTYGQGAGQIQRLSDFVARGWRFEDMSVVPSDVGAGMRETHILVSWKAGQTQN